jgi:hypothetical protein
MEACKGGKSHPHVSPLDRGDPEYPTFLTGSETVVSYKGESIWFTNAFGKRDIVPGWFVRAQRAKRERDGK